MRRVRPVAPPGKSPPVRTKDLILKAIRADAMIMTRIRLPSF